MANFLDHWQSLIARLVGAAAAIAAVLFTLRGEARRRNLEVDSLRAALGIEIRLFALRAYEGHLRIRARLAAGEQILVRNLEDDARFPSPVIYRNTSNALGAFGNYTHDIVLFFGQVDLTADAIRRLSNLLSPNGSVDRPTATHLADSLLTACLAAVAVQPAFKGTPRSEHGAEFSAVVSKALKTWEAIKARFSEAAPFTPFSWGESPDVNRHQDSPDRVR